MQKILESLSPLERKVFPLLKDKCSFTSLLKDSGLKDIELMRALGWLEGKKLILMKKNAAERIVLGKNGEEYLKKGLPEKRFLKAVEEESLTLDEVKVRADLDNNESGVSLGVLKRRKAVEFVNKIKITSYGKELLKNGLPEERFLRKLPLVVEKLSNEEDRIYNELKQRKEIIKVELVKEMEIEFTSLGRELKKQKIEDELIESLTPNLLKSGYWKDKKFRRYDINSVVPKFYPGRRHFTNEAVAYIRKIWLDMGFKEMRGEKVQTSFWDFDALFTPQDHPAREMQDTFFIKNPALGKLPDAKIVKAVKGMHESGGKIGSRGWGGVWDEKEARRNVLITHDTYLSAKVLAGIKTEDLPIKTFQIMKVFRNESLDWKHLFEFHQVGGIVVDENINFRHLLGYLREFFLKMGFEKVRFRPSHFPYTEPSVEVDVFHPVHKKWIELGGSGVFRPELVVPLLGKDVPVLAWGLGIERIISDYYGFTDIRDVYRNDLKLLREIKVWMK